MLMALFSVSLSLSFTDKYIYIYQFINIQITQFNINHTTIPISKLNINQYQQYDNYSSFLKQNHNKIRIRIRIRIRI